MLIQKVTCRAANASTRRKAGKREARSPERQTRNITLTQQQGCLARHARSLRRLEFTKELAKLRFRRCVRQYNIHECSRSLESLPNATTYMSSSTSQQLWPTQDSMVSHADIAGSGPPRGPPSVSSRASTSNRRHHRHGRSHHGGSTYQPQNEFPFFAHTGDVEIIVSADGQEKRYLLHRLILAQCSGFFEAGTSEEWSRVQAQREAQVPPPEHDRALARIGEDPAASKLSDAPVTAASLSGRPPPKTRWRYELDWATAEDDEEPMLVQKVSLSKF